MTDRELLGHIGRSAGSKAGYKQLVRELGLGGGRERRLLLEQLARMTVRGQLVKLDREMWALPSSPAVAGEGRPGAVSQTRDNLVAGRLDLHRDGFGFVRPNARQQQGQDDIFIPPTEINGAMQGDQVLVELAPARGDGRRLGRIARVLERKNPTVVGVFHYGQGRYAGRGRYPGNSVVPFDDRMTQAVVIPEGMEVPGGTGDEQDGEAGPDLVPSQDLISAPRPISTPHRVLGEEALAAAQKYHDLEGMVVDVEITSWPTPTRPALGRVIEVLGHPDDFGVDVEIMIRKHHLPHVFPEKVLAEARAVARLDMEEVARRRDFRGLPIVTIDGETARDFDDAVMVRELAPDERGGPDGTALYELQVHIADVSEYVRPATDLDLEARLRGTSCYFPDRAIPMLPQELSSDICSLRPGEDRLVLSCLMRLTEDARIVSFEIVEGVIRSAARMTYTAVAAILDGDAATREQYAALVPEFERMRWLAGRMNKRRSERGSIDFDLPEPVIEFNAMGQMQGVTRAERSWANRLIEEFMLAANECVATWLEDLGVPSIYRIHEKPDPRRVVDFEEQAAGFGYSLGLGALPVKRMTMKGDRREAARAGREGRSGGAGRQPRVHEVVEDIPVTPRMYQRLSKRIAGKPEERILSFLMLRSLKQAKYSEENEGHFALAAPSYTHFTSPIRRYPDLIVHRIAKQLLRAGVSGKGEIGEDRHRSPWWHPNEGDAPGLAPHRGLDLRSPYGKACRDTGLGPDRKGEGLEGQGPIPLHELANIAAETSATERRAAEAERELVEWKKVRFMQDRVGEEFDAMVLNPAKHGLFVELVDLFVEGLVPIDSLAGDRYSWRETTREIVGEHGGRRFRAGDRVRVALEKVLAQERKLQFGLVDEELGAQSAYGLRPKGKAARAAGGARAGGAKKGKRKAAAVSGLASGLSPGLARGAALGRKSAQKAGQSKGKGKGKGKAKKGKRR